jgi:hypothetical protein
VSDFLQHQIGAFANSCHPQQAGPLDCGLIWRESLGTVAAITGGNVRSNQTGPQRPGLCTVRLRLQAIPPFGGRQCRSRARRAAALQGSHCHWCAPRRGPGREQSPRHGGKKCDRSKRSPGRKVLGPHRGLRSQMVRRTRTNHPGNQRVRRDVDCVRQKVEKTASRLGRVTSEPRLCPVPSALCPYLIVHK